MTQIQLIRKESFKKEVEEYSGTVLVDFSASWCGPCKALEPILEEFAEEYGKALKICKVDVDLDKDLAVDFNVKGIPNLMIFRDGKPKAREVGMTTRSKLKEFINRNL